MKTRTQNMLVLTALARGDRLTPRSALDRFGCFRLAARIKDLRDAGHNIVTRLIADNVTGNPYAEYTLIHTANAKHGLDASEGAE